MQEEYGVAAMASLQNWQANDYQDNIGFAVIALANRTDINVLRDIVGRKVCLLQDWILDFYRA